MSRVVGGLSVAALVLAGCISERVVEFDTTSETLFSTLGDTTTSSAEPSTSTTVAGDLGSLTFDLLDGSEIEAAAPTQLELGGYFYFIEIRGLGEANVYLNQHVDGAAAAAVEDAEFHSDLEDGVKLWVGDREGRPLFMTVETGGWVSLVHVGWETPPEPDFLAALAVQLRGEPSGRGVVIPDFDIAVFQTSLHEPDSENSVQLWAGQCLQERIPGSETVEHPDRGEMITMSGYASWCEPENDIELTVSGAEPFVDEMVATLMLTRIDPSARG